jgi:hypothetical protein
MHAVAVSEYVVPPFKKALASSKTTILRFTTYCVRAAGLGRLQQRQLTLCGCSEQFGHSVPQVAGHPLERASITARQDYGSVAVPNRTSTEVLYMQFARVAKRTLPPLHGSG